jgi:hypothetical protein
VVLPSNITSLATSVFNGCSSLEQVTIPAKVSSIGNAIFDS